MGERQERQLLNNQIVWRDFSENGIAELKRKLLGVFPEFEINPNQLCFLHETTVKRLERKEITAILGYEQGKIVIPPSPTFEFTCNRLHVLIADGIVTTDQINFKRVSLLTEYDANSLGFKDLSQLRLGMWRSFEGINQQDVVTLSRVADFRVNWHHD